MILAKKTLKAEAPIGLGKKNYRFALNTILTSRPLLEQQG